MIEHPKRHHALQASRLVHEHFGTIMSFAYSKLPLRRLIDEKFGGEWMNLRHALFKIPEERATRALVELGLYIRVIDDEEQKDGEHYVRDLWGDCGELVRKDDSRVSLKPRDVANKIIHAAHYEWVIQPDADPVVICFADPGESWKSASINLPALCWYCGTLMS